jgi:hypothetical protein
LLGQRSAHQQASMTIQWLALGAEQAELGALRQVLDPIEPALKRMR